jgi:outer membrane biosynthesis protein TonB
VNLKGIWPSVGQADHPAWSWMVLISALLHGAGVIMFWGWQHYAPRRAFNPDVIAVSLVGPVTSAPAPGPARAPSPAQEPAPSPSESSTTQRSRIPLPVPQAERKLVSIRPSEVKAPERTAPAPSVEKPSPAPPSPSAGASQGASRTATTGPQVPGAPAGAGGGGGKLTAEEARYLEMLKQRIQENWRAYLSPEEDVPVQVRIQIASDGRIREFAFVKGSGKSHIDSSVVGALKKVVLPPPPSSLADQPLDLRFLPSGPQALR